MVAKDVGANPFNLHIYNNTVTKRRRLNGYIDLELTQNFGVDTGTGHITIPADHPLAARIMQSAEDVVPFSAEKNGWQWTGYIDDYTASGKPGRETITANLVDEKRHLHTIVARPRPGASLLTQGKADRQSGPLESVVYHYISENIADTQIPCYMVMPPQRMRDQSPKIDLYARMTPLDELLKDVLDQHDYTIDMYMWRPGRPFPDGKIVEMLSPDSGERHRNLLRANLDQTFSPDTPALWQPSKPGLIIHVRPVRERRHVRFATNGHDVVEFRLTGKTPGAQRAIVGGKSDDWVNESINLAIDLAVQGILTALGAEAAGPVGAAIGAALGGIAKDQLQDSILAFTDRTDVQKSAEIGPFRPQESFTSSQAGVFTFDTSALAERALLDAAGGRGIEMTIADGVSKVLGVDERASNGKIRHGWLVGDRCTFAEHLSGTVVSDIITGVTVTDKVGERCRVTPKIGKKKTRMNGFLTFADKLSSILSRQNDLSMA